MVSKRITGSTKDQVKATFATRSVPLHQYYNMRRSTGALGVKTALDVRNDSAWFRMEISTWGSVADLISTIRIATTEALEEAVHEKVGEENKNERKVPGTI